MSHVKILNVIDQRVVIDENLLSVPEFKDLYDHVDGNLHPFQYLWAMYDPYSPYENYSEDIREQKVLNDFPDVIMVLRDIEMELAKQRAEEMFNSPIRKILKGAKSAIEKFAAYFETTEIEHGRDGNITAIKSALVDLPKLIKAYQEAESAYMLELESIRGQQRVGVDEGASDSWDD